MPPSHCSTIMLRKTLALHAALFALFSALAVAFTWPLAARIDEPVGAYGDGPMFLWDLWWFRHAVVDLHQNPFHTNAIFHPLGNELYFHTFTPARGLLALPLLGFMGVAAASNLLFLLGFVLAGHGMYLLARRLGAAPGAAVWAAVAYSFCQNHVARGYGHLNLTDVQWFPWFVLALERGFAEFRGAPG